MAAVMIMLVTVAICLFTFWFYKTERLRRKLDVLGGPRSIPLLGNVHQLKVHPGDFTRQLFHMFYVDFPHLPVWRLMIGSWPMVLICSPEEAEPIVTSAAHLDKSSDYSFIEPWIGQGLLTSTGERWKSRRKLLTPTFHFNILQDFITVFNEQTKILIETLRQKSTDQSPVDVCDDITLCALDIICETAMGQSVNAQRNRDSEYVQSVHKVAEYTMLRVRSPWYKPRLLFNMFGPGKQYDKCLNILHGFTEKVIREKQNELASIVCNQGCENGRVEDGSKKRHLAFLDMLLQVRENGEQLPFHEIRDEVDTFMFEGHDTTAMATSWAVYLIGSHPLVQEKIHQELHTVFGDSSRDATTDDLKDLKYLECCIKEALRIYPSVPMFGRSLTKDTNIGGVTVPRGTTTIILSWAIHMNKAIYPEPEKFDPDRFLPENSCQRNPYAYLPFSAGSRNCIGQKFALLEEKVLLSTIFRNFTVKSTQSREELSPVMGLILRPGNGIRVILKPRINTAN